MGERERLICPDCGCPISCWAEPWPRIGSDSEITITITCEMCDYSGFAIKTGLGQKDLKKFSKPLKEPITKEMKIIGEEST